MEAIIRSMTRAERRDPSLIDGSRRQRIARGSGTTTQDVNQLLKQFGEAQKLMRSPGMLGGVLGGAKGGRAGLSRALAQMAGDPSGLDDLDGLRDLGAMGGSAGLAGLGAGGAKTRKAGNNKKKKGGRVTPKGGSAR